VFHVKHLGIPRLGITQPDTINRDSSSQHLHATTNNYFPNPAQKPVIQLGSGIIQAQHRRNSSSR
jgi:hypothetical protein